MGFNKLGGGGAGEGGEGDKHKKVLDWGTPRLVTKNRQLVVDQKTMQQRALLQNIASIRTGPVADKVEEKKTDFKAVTVSNFRERMLQEEKMEAGLPTTGPTPGDTVVVEQNSQPTTSTTYPPTTSIRPLGALPAGLNPGVPSTGGAGVAGVSMFNKFKNLGNEDDAMNKLK